MTDEWLDMTLSLPPAAQGLFETEGVARFAAEPDTWNVLVFDELLMNGCRALPGKGKLALAAWRVEEGIAHVVWRGAPKELAPIMGLGGWPARPSFSEVDANFYF